MSNNSGVFILQCNDQYRVALIHGCDTLRWSHIDKEFGDLKSVRLYEAFHQSKEWRHEDEALWDARRILKSYDYYVEYGIQYVLVDRSWDEIEAEALQEAWDELEYLSTPEHNDGRWNDAVESLNKVIEELSVLN